MIVHIVQAIRKETERVRDEWELQLCSANGLSNSGYSQDVTKNSDTYCFEMLSMVLALSGSSVGRAYLSHQGGLLGDLLSLLHTGSARVQRQVNQFTFSAKYFTNNTFVGNVAFTKNSARNSTRCIWESNGNHRSPS